MILCVNRGIAFRFLVVILCLALTACADLSRAQSVPNVALQNTPAATGQDFAPAQIQCYYQGEVIFDQMFDHAQISDTGQITVWRRGQSAVLNGDCKVAH